MLFSHNLSAWNAEAGKEVWYDSFSSRLKKVGNTLESTCSFFMIL